MNKSHRIVWSDARNAYIVAGENASAKGKPSSVRKALATAIAALFMGPGLAAAQSCEGQNPLTDAQTSTQCYENVDVTVAAGGSVAATGTTAIGVQVQAAPYARNFANQGTLEADAEGYNAYAYGVLFEGRVSGSVVNASTGTVSVSATGQGDGYGDGYGVLIRGDLGGSLANAGTVEVSAQNVTSSGYRYAGAYGVSIDGDVDGTLTNSGNVRAESRADSAGGSSYSFTDSESVRIRGSLNGALANSGAIEAHAQSAEGSSNYNDYVRAYGVSIGEDLTGSLENTGTIHAAATRSSEGGYSSYSDYMWAVGVHVSDDLTGELLNSGEILARTEVSGGDQYGYANAYGVRAYGTMSGTIDNAGTIRAESVRTAGEGGSSTYTKAYGVVTGDLVGKLANSGSIGARSEVEEGYAHAYAYGVSTYYGDLIGTIQNDGEIAAEAVSKDGYAGAYGVGVGYNVSGTLQNNGEVSARAEASNARSRGVSIRYGDLTGTIGNDGTIDATSITQDGYANAVGVGFGTGEDYDGEDSYGYGKVSGTLRNAGTVTATAISQGREGAMGVREAMIEEDSEPGEDAAVRAGGVEAYGIVTGAVSGPGAIENTGAVVAEARTEAVAEAGRSAYAESNYADAVGIGTGPLDGALSNSGSVTANAAASATADGIFAEADGGEAWALGVGFGAASGSFENGGTLNASANSTAVANGVDEADADADDAEAIGVAIASEYEDQGTFGGKLDNSGSVQAVATASARAAAEAGSAYAEAGYVDAIGVGIYAEVDGTLTNGGQLNATAQSAATASGSEAEASASSAWAAGVVIAPEWRYASLVASEAPVAFSGRLENSGTIEASAVSTAEATAQAEGSAVAEGSYAAAYGIVSAAVDGKVSNTGSVSASAIVSASATGDAATAKADRARASGVSFGDAGGDFENSGSIVSRATVTALANGGASASASAGTDEAAGGAEAAGVEIWVSGPGAYTGNFTNSGTIQAEATVSAVATGEEAEARSYDGASAYGVMVDGFDGRFTNTGTIHASASATVTANGENVGEAADAGAIGVWVLGRVGAGGVLDNSGTISAVAEAAAKGMSVVAGVMIGSDEIMSEPTLAVMDGEDVPEDGFYGTLNNSGTITAEGRGGIESAGVFSVFASGGTGTVNNLQGGLMSGRLLLGGEVAMNNAGMLDIRDSASYVGGAFTQSATGVLKIDVVPVSDEGAVIDTYGSLYVGGTAQLADGTGVRVMVDPASTLASGDKLDDVVFAEGDITRGTVKVADNVLPLNFMATSDASPKDLDLSVVGTGLTTISNAVNTAGLSSATGVAGVLDGLLGSADSQPGALGDFLFDVGSSGNAREVADKVATLLPLASGGVTTATLGALHGANRVVQARVDSNLGRSSGDGFLGDKRMWLKGFGSWAEQDARSGASGYDADTAGLAVGVDAIVTDTNRVGVLFAYSETDVDSTGAAKQSADVDTYQLGLYGSHTLDERTDINGMIGFGRHSTDGTRHTTGGVAASSYDSSSIVAGVGIARTYPMSEKTTLTPSVRLDYARIKDDAYQEQGAGALDLSVGKNTVSELILSLDGKITHELSDTLTFVGHAGVGYDFENEQSSITSTLAGAPGASFVTRGVDPSPWLVRAGLGLVNTPIESWEFSARYEVEGRSDFLNHTAWLRARKAF